MLTGVESKQIARPSEQLGEILLRCISSVTSFMDATDANASHHVVRSPAPDASAQDVWQMT